MLRRNGTVLWLCARVMPACLRHIVASSSSLELARTSFTMFSMFCPLSRHMFCGHGLISLLPDAHWEADKLTKTATKVHNLNVISYYSTRFGEKMLPLWNIILVLSVIIRLSAEALFHVLSNSPGYNPFFSLLFPAPKKFRKLCFTRATTDGGIIGR